jgi:hypothetical protein
VHSSCLRRVRKGSYHFGPRCSGIAKTLWHCVAIHHLTTLAVVTKTRGHPDLCSWAFILPHLYCLVCGFGKSNSRFLKEKNVTYHVLIHFEVQTASAFGIYVKLQSSSFVHIISAFYISSPESHKLLDLFCL